MPYLNTNNYNLPYFQPNYNIQIPDLSGSHEIKFAQTIDLEESGILTVHNSLIDGVVSEGVFRDNLTGVTFQGRLFQNVQSLSELYRTLYTPTVNNTTLSQTLSGIAFTNATTWLPLGLSNLLVGAKSNTALQTLYSGIDQQNQIKRYGSANYIENIGLTVQIHGKTGFVPASSPIRWVINDIKQDTLLYVAVQETGFPGTPRSTLKFNQIAPITSYVPLSGTPQGFVPGGYTLVATRKSGIGTVIDLNPPGKVNIQTVADHAGTNLNPHGSPLYISGNIITSGITLFGPLTVPQLNVAEVIIDPNSLLTQKLPQQPIPNNVFISGNLTVNQSTSLSGNVFSNQNKILGTLTIGGSGSLTVSGISTVISNITLASGVTVDGLLFSGIKPLIDGANLPAFIPHSHLIYAQHRSVSQSPRFPNMGVIRSDPNAVFRVQSYVRTHDGSVSMYGGFTPNIQYFSSGTVAVGLTVPHGFVSWKNIEIRGRVGEQSVTTIPGGLTLKTDSKYMLGIKDIHGAEAYFDQSGTGLQNNRWKKNILTGISGTYIPGENFWVRSEMFSYSGSPVDLGGIVLNYYTIPVPTPPAGGYGTDWGVVYGFDS